MSTFDETEVATAVTDATAEDSFDALAFFSGAALPEDIVTLYADAGAAYEIAKFKEEEKEREARNAAEGLGLTDDDAYDNTDEDHLNELYTRLRASAVKFHLKGLPPKVLEVMDKHIKATHPYKEGAENAEYNEVFNAELIAKTIVSVTNLAGKVDPNPWTPARVQEFAVTAEPSEFHKLFVGVFKVNYIGNAIDAAVTADFS
jgi:hypothetical protein